MAIILVHIEPLEERYSKQWLDDLKDKVDVILGSTEEQVIKDGEFLDVYDTNLFKLNQGIDIINYVRTHKLTKDDTIFFLDLWNPVVTMLGYVRDCMNLDFKIAGMLHAGTWDEWDFLSRSGMGRWAKGLEYSMIQVADKVIVATEFHKELIRKDIMEFTNIIVEDFPIFTDDIVLDKKNIVVFPHRLAPEKDVDYFWNVAKEYKKKYNDDTVFIESVGNCNSKQDYYNLLAESKVSFSSAKQETFGIAMLESLNLGCIPVVPNRLSYRETLPGYTYNNIEEAIEMVRDGIMNWKRPKKYTVNNFDNILKRLK